MAKKEIIIHKQICHCVKEQKDDTNAMNSIINLHKIHTAKVSILGSQLYEHDNKDVHS